MNRRTPFTLLLIDFDHLFVAALPSMFNHDESLFYLPLKHPLY
ncbi:hypothetical protein ACFOU2_16805 [Bacillus songklensis]|uniref:Uncharacterized protein n=1 Tax=Bacillus songklensis TaxID=1069116 RepID=A0ABV8B5X9_9BACI